MINNLFIIIQIIYTEHCLYDCQHIYVIINCFDNKTDYLPEQNIILHCLIILTWNSVTVDFYVLLMEF